MYDEYREQRRFWSRVISDATGCWLWIGGKRKSNYGTFAVRNGTRWTQTTSQRFAYMDQVGLIPQGYEVDHLCRVRNCVRPEHLEAITVQENRRRRDLKIVFKVPTDHRPLPAIPPKPQPLPKRDPARFCINYHEYAITGKVANGFNKDGSRRFTCAECRKIKTVQRRKGNAAKNRTHCPYGHAYSGENLVIRTRFSKAGNSYQSRECRTCVRRWNRSSVNPLPS